MSAEAPEIRADPPPHPAAALDHDALCPLCGYSLRGLTDPRCPECGHRFVWHEVLCPEAEVRWLYEHATSPGIRAFAWTAIGCLWLPRFWRRVKPVHAVRVRRLCGYVFRIVALTLTIAMAVGVYWTALQCAARANERARQMKLIAGWRGTPQQTADWQRAYRVNTAQEYVDRYWPAPNFLDVAGMWSVTLLDIPFLRWSFHGGLLGEPHRSGLLRTVVLAIAWPLLTLATFAIFRVSLRLAAIRWRHVLRLVSYSATLAALGPLIWVAADVAEPWRYVGLPLGWDSILGLRSAGGWALYLTTAAVATGLTVGAVRYLRIPHAAAMAASSQLIVLLLLLACGMYAM